MLPPSASHQLRRLTADGLPLSAERRFGELRRQVGLAAAIGPVILAGDFNARIGVEPAPSPPAAPSGRTRGCTDTTVTAHGRLLAQLSADTGLVLCTGHAPGDEAALPTWHRGRSATRLDHILVSPAIYSAISSCTVGALRDDSDHCPLQMQLALFTQLTPPPPLGGSCWAAGSGRAAANMTHHSMTRSAMRRRDSCAACFAAASTAMPAARGLRINITASCVGRSARGSGSSSTSCWTSCTESRVTSGSASTASSPECRGSCKIQRLGRPTCAYSQLAPSAQAASEPTVDMTAAAECLNADIDSQEVLAALHKMQNGRASGNSEFPAEFLRYAVAPREEATDDGSPPPHQLAGPLAQLLNAAFTTGCVPEAWTTSLVTPLLEKGGPSDTANYRPVAVGAPGVRLYAAVLNARLMDF